jgi:hypothetical protein
MTGWIKRTVLHYRDRAAGVAVWAELDSRSLLGYFVQKDLPLISGEELEEP